MKGPMLVLVVGPSGAGKDTVLAYAKAHLAGYEKVVFPRRVITRPPGPGEDHVCVTEAEFASARFALAWQAHGLHYGIPADIERDLAAQRIVIINVSRGVIAEARARFPCMVVEITAPPEILAQRLAARGREDAADIAERLRREGAQIDADVTIINDRLPQDAGAMFLAKLS
ncbi:phosphonate metabolism protein/1,5-bisphosphokinase (PRPP-forming) PhnN [Acidocella facilis]|uniref:phosphonate metabolism protein/1,5-bisphosphokinase (PRPP-forming) PhnN n=1 Tax=Acidocella facilis TaxID=525 RepID=UPI00047DCC15|nr:phosphonate metabolism protein/1,5-bisphosphokinase (PRPP-forming) PhnN [Acidocella facilis]